MRVILDETSHSGQSTERTGRLVSVENAKLGHADRQLSVVTGPGAENESVPRAVHRLQRPNILLNLEGEHVFVVICETEQKVCQLRDLIFGRRVNPRCQWPDFFHSEELNMFGDMTSWYPRFQYSDRIKLWSVL